mgnify:CR=1 FL=1
MHQVEAEDQIVAQALLILSRRCAPGEAMVSPATVKHYLTVRAAFHSREVFGCMFLDVRNCILACEDMFAGTLTQTSVYPREIVRRCLELGAAHVILTHNHPSGNPTHSRADEALTAKLKTALDLVDVRVLDHVITAGGAALSMAEQGLI